MKLGIGTYIFRWGIGTKEFRPTSPLGPVDLVNRCAELGVGVLQYADNVPLHTLPESEIATIKRTAQAKRVDLEIGTRAFGFHLEHLLRYLDIAQRLECSLMRLVIDSPLDTQAAFEESLAFVRNALPRFRRARVRIAIENFLAVSPKLVEFIRALDDPYVGICLDTANTIGEQEWPPNTIRTLAPYAINVHLKDCRILPGPYGIGYTITGAPWGEGIQDTRLIMEAIRSTGRDMNLILEQWMPPAGSESETLQQEMDWIRRSVESARRMMQA